MFLQFLQYNEATQPYTCIYIYIYIYSFFVLSSIMF